MRSVLYVDHSHLTIGPGGAEVYADELYRAIRDAGEFEPMFVARAGSPQSNHVARDGTRLLQADRDPRLYYFCTQPGEFDSVLRSAPRKQMYTEDWQAILNALQPDVVHFHHSYMLGFDMLSQTRRTLPGAAIVYHLHDFGPICHHGGMMVRTQTFELCSQASPRRCHQCFSDVPAQTFFLRERFIKAMLEHVDVFIAPSAQLRHRYVAWGIAPDRIRVEQNGRIPVAAVPDPPDAGRRRRLGFFGRLSQYKGAEVLLEAMKLLADAEVGVELVIWGMRLERQPRNFRERFAELLQETAGTVTFAGSYRAPDLPALMSDVDWVVVPSIWWENSPMVIQEAMMHRRPVICSDIGGMAENVIDGVQGLHFRVGDADSLADTIRRAVDSPELWDEIRDQLTDPHPMSRHVEFITRLYRELLAPAGAAARPA